MNLEIISPDKNLYNGEVKMVIVPGSKGAFGILRNHAPLISTLEAGIIKITEPDNKENEIRIKSGVVEVLENKVVILATV